ncbi:cupin domain-containing protein [Streptomyces parvulus]|uniref:Protein in whiE locus n=1 Tax=Streptomyces parvulus TaxID=146923 RepID=A0A191V399_9ACTN|nr:MULTISPECIES: cupin domain-containing protein [Streptomyces]ANJ09496.1 protein in whiE locus [Streptomyces parvulus]MCC9154395.1 cupin domain-containing protein [Streptomyces parvulus]MCE7686161.1 cupin domain-containing protein [Streptomyces parvulus]MCQ4191804.1 cupin domain-containing protein [Streptomyces parvulus]WML82541.1 cupin domain-containing protein [Streptomyces sp. VNUA74]
MTDQQVNIISIGDVAPNRRRGGDIRAVLTPTSAGATSGFMGVAIVQPGERIAEHYHPYSEEFVYVTEGALEVDLNGTPHALTVGQGMLIPQDMCHRFRNVGDVEARLVFHLGPLAPRPELGHVDTEDAAGNAIPHERPAAAAEAVS